MIYYQTQPLEGNDIVEVANCGKEINMTTKPETKDQKMKKYWLSYENRGYAEHEVYSDEKRAIERYRELGNCTFPILIYGKKIEVKYEN